MKNVKILALAALMVATQGLRANAPAPTFIGGAIRTGANFGLCGLLTITPVPKAQLNEYVPVDRQYQTLYVRAVQYNNDGNEVKVTGEGTLPIQGKQFSYGWAGLGDAHFKIYVYAKDDKGNEIPLDPSTYVTIKVDHNGTCVGDRDSKWEPLKMR